MYDTELYDTALYDTELYSVVYTELYDTALYDTDSPFENSNFCVRALLRRSSFMN